MKVLVTGGAGYLGSVLALELLRAGHEVRVFDNLMYGGLPLLAAMGQDGFEFLRGDLRDGKAIRHAVRDVEGVVHLGAIVGDPACARQPETAKDVNVRAALDLVDAARQAGVKRFVFASTCSNYGKMADTSVFAEEDCELRPVSLYAETKVAVERELLNAPSSSFLVTVLRFATLYGVSPRMRFDLTVNEFVMEMLVRRRVVVYGEHFWRPYVHVRDAARAVMDVLRAPREAIAGQVFNVGDTQENYRKVDLVEAIRKRVGDCDVQFIHKAEDPRDYRVSFDRIRDRLGYTIARRLTDGIHEIAAAIESAVFDDLSSPLYYNVKPS